MDLDNFKQYNDLYGHLVGDTILREVGKIIKMSVDKFDLVARYGGEEFVVVLVDASLEEGVKVAERIRGNIAAHKFFVGGKVSYITVSIGVSSLPEDGWEKEILLGKADQLTYRAKEKGKNCVVSTLTNR
jgi:diguanylate cyclase (GGDEF)-like protein